MSRLRKACVILIGALVVIPSWAAAQTEEANAILGQAGSSVIALIAYVVHEAD